MYYVKFYSLIVIIGITFFSCSKKDYEADLPTYISINQITVSANTATEGSSSSNIVDAWVFVNDDLVGVFELPAKFPVLKEGDATIKIYAGIKDNGVSSARRRYLLYAPHVEQINLVKGETLYFNPTVTYAANANFVWLEDFESPSLSFLLTSGSDTTIHKQNTTVLDGLFSGRAILGDQMDFFEVTSMGFSSIPRNGNVVYLEMDFKTNENLLVGVFLDNQQYAVVTLNTTDTWKKIYINLTDIINNSVPASEMKVFFGIKETSSNTFLTSNPDIYFDNLKLIHL